MTIRSLGTSPRGVPFALGTLAVAALAAWSGAARAQNLPPPLQPGPESSSPYYLRVSETLTYDSNVFRVPESLGERRDGISSTALTAGLDQHLGRQRLLGIATVRGNVFKNNDQLNNTGYDLGAQLNWEAASRWAGDARVNFSQTLARFEDYGSQTQVTSGKNQEKVALAALRAQYGLFSLWSIEGTYNHFDINYSADTFANRERTSDQAGLGVKFRPSGLWTFGLNWRETRGEYPQYREVGGVTEKDEYDRTDIDLTARYFATGLSTLSARLSHTSEEHSIDSTRDFSGVTGEIRWDYQATGKLGISTTLARETGSGSSSSSFGDTTSYLTDSRLTNRLTVNARWNATAKIQVRAGAILARDKFDDQFTSITVNGQVVSASGQTADSRTYSLSALYAATRSINFECGARYQKRDPIITSGSTFLGYTANTAYCAGALTLQ
ncbi:hypothetical protein [Caldimonas sp. KR1-144]|uniref:hypothetical protein n=1 Tax=Caldimonas sp. KR1-144 TaxID=3400911 RepID=UPI003C0A0A46